MLFLRKYPTIIALIIPNPCAKTFPKNILDPENFAVKIIVVKEDLSPNSAKNTIPYNFKYLTNKLSFSMVRFSLIFLLKQLSSWFLVELVFII